MHCCVPRRGPRPSTHKAFLGSSSAVRTRSSRAAHHRAMSPKSRFLNKPALAVTVVACGCVIIAGPWIVARPTGMRPGRGGAVVGAEPGADREPLRRVPARSTVTRRSRIPPIRSDGRMSFGAQEDAVDAASRALRGTTCRRELMALKEAPPKPPTAAELRRAVRFSQCMRERGVPDWPDPHPDGTYPLDARLRRAGKGGIFGPARGVPAPRSRRRDPGQPVLASCPAGEGDGAPAVPRRQRRRRCTGEPHGEDRASLARGCLPRRCRPGPRSGVSRSSGRDLRRPCGCCASRPSGMRDRRCAADPRRRFPGRRRRSSRRRPRRALPADLDRSAGGRVADGVVEEVAEYALEAVAVEQGETPSSPFAQEVIPRARIAGSKSASAPRTTSPRSATTSDGASSRYSSRA